MEQTFSNFSLCGILLDLLWRAYLF